MGPTHQGTHHLDQLEELTEGQIRGFLVRMTRILLNTSLDTLLAVATMGGVRVHAREATRLPL